jgi:hypothetical protein
MKTNITLKTINELVKGIKDLGDRYMNLHGGESEYNLYWFMDEDGILFVKVSLFWIFIDD